MGKHIPGFFFFFSFPAEGSFPAGIGDIWDGNGLVEQGKNPLGLLRGSSSPRVPAALPAPDPSGPCPWNLRRLEE